MNHSQQELFESRYFARQNNAKIIWTFISIMKNLSPHIVNVFGRASHITDFKLAMQKLFDHKQQMQYLWEWQKKANGDK